MSLIVYEMIIMISKTKTTTNDPFFEDDWYRCLRTRYAPIGNKWYVQRRLSGGNVENLYIVNITEFTGKMRISVNSGNIYFNDISNDLQYNTNYAFSSDVYFYIFTSTHTERHTGTDYMDDWRYD